MAATTLVREFLRSVCITLQDISPQYSRWPEHELVIYANYAQRAIAKFLPLAGSRVDSIKLTPGTKQDLTKVLLANIVPGDGSSPANTYGIQLLDVVKNMGANGTTAGRVVRVGDRYTKDNNDPDWHTRVDTVVKEYYYDKNIPKVFYVVPGVHASTPVWVEIAWMAEPRLITVGGEPGSEIYKYDGSNAELMGIGDQFIEDAHNYTVAIALMKGSKSNQNMPKASAHGQLFISSINAQAAAISGTSPNLKVLPFADSIPGAQ